MKVGIVGATGAVGEELIKVLEERKFPVSKLVLYASERSSGKKVSTKTLGDLEIVAFSFDDAVTMDILFLAVSGEFATEYAPKLAQAGPVVIDNSSAFRYDPEVPLIIPEINGDVLTEEQKLIANPNCTTAVAAVALWPLHKKYGIKRLIVSSYQASSGAGAEGMAELKQGVADYVAGKPVTNKVFQHPLAFNVIPQIDKFQPNGYTKEEMKVCWETRKIFDLPQLPVSCTAVRVPTLRAHAEALTMETEKPVCPDEAREVLNSATGVTVADDVEKFVYPMPITATNKYDVEVGRIRQSLVFENGLDLFVCGDQLLRGAALNAVLIAELVVSLKGDRKRQKINGE